MIPEFDSDGELPPGVHVATLDEVRQRFGIFSLTNRRPQLFTKLSELVEVARVSGIVDRLIIAGSFVTAKAAPNDFDVLIIFNTETDIAKLRLDHKVLVDRSIIRRRFRGDDLDVLSVRNGTQRMRAMLEFFQYNRDAKPIGIVEVVF